MQDTLNILLPETSEPDYIEHHGVKGMHWGVRKARYKQNVKNIKEKYKIKNKEIRKERRKDVKKYLTTIKGFKKSMYDVETIKSHGDKIAVNDFKKKQELKRAKSTLYKDINNRKSEKYLKKAKEQFMTFYGNRTVIKKPNGQYVVTRYYQS